jgi:L-lactate dehydrogenase (cytochrome)
LVLTVDLQVLGQRHRDIKNGLSVPPQIYNMNNLIDFACKPSWLLGTLRGKRRNFGNIAGHVRNGDDLKSVSAWTASQFDTTLTWKDVDWIRSIWPGRLIVKGIHDPEDARQLLATGAEALVVSNHGGRQLDGAPSSISVLPKIVDAVGSEIEVIFDGGILSGQDVMRALALGAKSCMIGRAYIYGLGAFGQRGVAKALDIIANELSVTMGLCGVDRIEKIDANVLAAPTPFSSDHAGCQSRQPPKPSCALPRSEDRPLNFARHIPSILIQRRRRRSPHARSTPLPQTKIFGFDELAPS